MRFSTSPSDTAAEPTTPERADDGYFGPGSVTWRVYTDPSSKLGGIAALLLQSLNPGMMRLFGQVSASYADPIGRNERTGRWLDTVMFGDRAHADAAAAVVRRMHEHARWTDPQTGEVIAADRPEWLAWTHNTLVWGMLRAAAAFGLELTRDEQNRFIVEQHEAGRLVGIDPATLPSTLVELDTYLNAQQDWLALTLPAANATRNLRKPNLAGNPLTVWTTVIVQDGVLAILPEWALLLHGIEGRPMNLRSARRTTKWLMGVARRKQTPIAVLGEIQSRVEAHPYRTVRPSRSTARG